MASTPPDRLVSPREIVASGLCIGCGACAGTAAPEAEARMRWDGYGQLKPDGARAWLGARTPAFSATCPFSPAARNEDAIAVGRFPDAPERHPLLGHVESAYVGHVAEDGFRAEGSSGGMVSWVAAELMRRGLVDAVAHVAPRSPDAGDGYFGYRIARSVEEVQAGAKSRYHPIHLADVIREIRAVPGRYAIVGVPCFMKAVNLLREQDPVLRDRIAFTLGLFCGHMKSARLVESFAWQLGAPLPAVEKVEYRLKDPNRPANWYTAHLTLKDGRALWKDWWHLADGDWGAGFFMNSACNFCDDVVAETADISFGDAWVEPYSSDGKGTNVVVVRSKEVDSLVQTAISEGRLWLKEESGEFIEQTQAAGFRQRREGLAYRLTWATEGVQPIKRVAPDANRPSKERKRIYKARYRISKWSNRMFWLARKLKQPRLYISWARLSLSVYHGLAYHQGKWSEMKQRWVGLKNG